MSTYWLVDRASLPEIIGVVSGLRVQQVRIVAHIPAYFQRRRMILKTSQPLSDGHLRIGSPMPALSSKVMGTLCVRLQKNASLSRRSILEVRYFQSRQELVM